MVEPWGSHSTLVPPRLSLQDAQQPLGEPYLQCASLHQENSLQNGSVTIWEKYSSLLREIHHDFSGEFVRANSAESLNQV